MKNLFFTVAAAVALTFALASCKKDRTCTCTTTATAPDGSTATDVDITTYNDARKGDARLYCIGESYTESDGTKVDETCELK